MNELNEGGVLQKRLSLGYSVLEANDIYDATPVITGNYIGPNHEMPLPWPSGDWYLRQTFVPAVSAGERVICHTLIPGLREYYSDVGLIPEEAMIIEVEPTTDIASDSPEFGYPNTDPLSILSSLVMFTEFGQNPVLCPTFDSSEISSHANALGIETLARNDSFLSNHKARLRESAHDYGITMLPGKNLVDWCDISDVIEADWNTSKGSWLKFPTGSGGDLVQKINGMATDEEIRRAREELRKYVKIAFEEGDFSISFNDFWPELQICPLGFPLVLEADASIKGDIVANGSSQFITNWRGETRVINHFTQMTTEAGEYLGNEPYVDIDDAVKVGAEKQVKGVADYNVDKHQYFGIAAIDWFATRDSSGVTSVSVGELNSRPTANTPPVIIAEKMGARHFVNINAYTQHPILSVEDYFDVVGKDFAFGDPGTNGMVLPQAFRSMVNRRGVLPSPNFKIVILGNSPEHCRDIMEQLSGRGIRFTPE